MMKKEYFCTGELMITTTVHRKLFWSTNKMFVVWQVFLYIYITLELRIILTLD